MSIHLGRLNGNRFKMRDLTTLTMKGKVRDGAQIRASMNIHKRWDWMKWETDVTESKNKRLRMDIINGVSYSRPEWKQKGSGIHGSIKGKMGNRRHYHSK